jgi:hypothetical protein
MSFDADSIELYLKPTGFEREIHLSGYAWMEIGRDLPINNPRVVGNAEVMRLSWIALG